MLTIGQAGHLRTFGFAVPGGNLAGCSGELTAASGALWPAPGSRHPARPAT
jgi:hypothetical protein